ncbi:hypothetical protein IEO21_05495 [Rhodonia placenta]|uniref:Uncharacterized protein n=1 Tax=Rhodonia placenta TaxID=104341 RepID=A0A8H7P1R1_9APHY|nr:hypothetical protein IEO21_05495 [Postia placenta]
MSSSIPSIPTPHGHICDGVRVKPMSVELPIELVLEILEIAAASSHLSAAAISRVSSWARKLALPCLFETLLYPVITLNEINWTSGQYFTKPYIPRHLPGPSIPLPLHVGHHVRNLWVERGNRGSPMDEINLFDICPDVEHLAIQSSSIGALYTTCRAGSRFPCSVRRVTMITPSPRYEIHVLDGLRLANGSLFLHNITHLHMLDLRMSTYVPYDRLPNLTHLAVPYLDLGANIAQEPLRTPNGVLDHPPLKMLVLTVDEAKYMDNSWYHTPRLYANGAPMAEFTSPRASFSFFMRQACEKDKRVHVVLYPRQGETHRADWKAAARGGESIWQKASQAMADEQYPTLLPEIYHEKVLRRIG